MAQEPQAGNGYISREGFPTHLTSMKCLCACLVTPWSK